jgi:hypothetical protein
LGRLSWCAEASPIACFVSGEKLNAQEEEKRDTYISIGSVDDFVAVDGSVIR